MDLYGDDRNLSELNEELNELLDNDAFTPTSSDSGCGMDIYAPAPMDEDWLDSFFEDPVLNDRMFSDALHPPTIRHEHSYSLADTAGPDSPLAPIKSEPMDHDLDADLLPCPTTSTDQLNLTFTPATLDQRQTTLKTKLDADSCSITNTSRAPGKARNAVTTTGTSSHCGSPAVTAPAAGSRTHPSSVVKQPTIILATNSTLTSTSSSSSHSPTQHSTDHNTHHSSNSSSNQSSQCKQERLVLPKVNIKVEPQEVQHSPEHLGSYHSLDLPPTPPSSNTSDSEGSQSPTRSAPSSPIRQSALRTVRALPTTTTLFSSPISQSGILSLSEEEKRTLISEGYPIPQKLPLTKQEEKNLKKIRRKIKNKISAQESRRKKKEYLETLEKKVEVYNQENVDLKKKVDSLENNNRSLMSQLQKLQAIVSKVTKPANSTQNTCLMVLVLCFAIFLGSWSPTNFSIGYSRAGAAPSALKVPMGPAVKEAYIDAYATTNKRSRVLLSLNEESEESGGGGQYGPATPFTYREMLVSFLHGSGGLLTETREEEQEEAPVDRRAAPPPAKQDPRLPQVHISDAQAVPDANLHNETGDRKMAAAAAAAAAAAVPHPDIMADVPAAMDNTSQ